MKTSITDRKRIAASGTSIVIIILLIAVVATVAYVELPGPTQSVICKLQGQTGCATTTPTTPNTQGNVAGKIQFNIQDLLAGGGQAASVNVYP
ncbi:MAG: hypothetical protein JRN51_10410, partial [Nitrososphaerota archaeon]|nr:hypothetical protein [Nitrososphaerota archaeon]